MRTWKIVALAGALIAAGAIVVPAVSDAAPQDQPLYVALGDSYTAGLGADSAPYQLPDMSVYDPATITADNPCFRSRNGYPQLVARELGYRLRNVSCSGATPEHITRTAQTGPQGLQIDAVTPDAKLVSVAIGFNPHFGNFVNCVLGVACADDSPDYRKTISDYTTVLPGQLDEITAQIAKRAPGATKVIIGYPAVLPQQTITGQCVAYLTLPNLRRAQQMLDALNQSIRDAANRSGFVYVDPARPGSPFYNRDLLGLGSDLCSVSAAAATWPGRVNIPVGAADPTFGSFHPNNIGEAHYARLLREALAR